LLLSHYSFTLDKQASGLCVDDKYQAVRRVAKYTSLENATTITNISQVYSNSNIFQINQSCKQYENYVLGSLYNVLKQK
jgi:hypothetical protein